MSTFKVNISLEASFTSQELADFFTALASSERGDSQPLLRILHPVAPPPPAPAPVAEAEPVPEPVAEATPPLATIPRPAVQNTQWKNSNIHLTEDANIQDIIRRIDLRELVSHDASFTWHGIKHHPRSRHNQNIINALTAAQNRTLSFVALRAQLGTNEKLLESYLREMKKQGIVTTTRRTL